MKNYILKLKIIIISILIVTSISCVKKDDDHSNQNTKVSSDSNTLSSNKSNYNLETDPTILITDSLGNILGGDLSDWDFDKRNYKNVLKQRFYPMYNNPDKIYTAEMQSFFSEVKRNSVILTWFTNTETNCEGFDVERTKGVEQNSDWNKVGFVKGNGNSNTLITYKYTDKYLLDGKYRYRLKQVSTNDDFVYHSLPNEIVITNYEKLFEFYPVYPNPVSSKFTVSVFLSKKDTVSLYFMKDKDSIYILNHEPQERGFYNLTLDKKTLGFENEIRRLYIDCESCSKKKNFGDIQF